MNEKDAKEIMKLNFVRDPHLAASLLRLGRSRKMQGKGMFEREFSEAEHQYIEECANDISTWDYKNHSGYVEGKKPGEKWVEFCKSELYAEIMASPKFAARLQSGEEIIDEFMVSIPENFNKHKDQVNDYLSNTLKIDDDMPPVDILITASGGEYLGANRILWGHQKSKEDSTYDPIFLGHEWLHRWVEHNGLQLDDIAHPIAELAMNEGLSRLLGGKPENMDFVEGRGEPEMREKLRPEFFEFTQSGSKSFVDFHKDMVERFGNSKDRVLDKVGQH